MGLVCLSSNPHINILYYIPAQTNKQYDKVTKYKVKYCICKDQTRKTKIYKNLQTVIHFSNDLNANLPKNR